MGAVCNRQVKIQSCLVYNLAFLLQKCQTFAVLDTFAYTPTPR